MRFGNRKRHQARRAISEMVSTLMLVAVVVALGVAVFTFASAGLGSLTSNFSGLISGQGNTVTERFVIEQATFCATGGCLASCSPACTLGADVFVRNVGGISSNIVSVYIVDQSTNTFVTQVALSPATVLNAGTFVDIPRTTLSFTPAHGHAYSFTVTSSLGNSVGFNAKAS